MNRVRFAPSPTGYLHVGNARTALMNFLFARNSGGRFVLRIEDTDLERSEVQYGDAILEDLRWLGIAWDEGPFRQSERGSLYGQYRDSLLEKGGAYRCFCSKERLEEMRGSAQRRGLPPRYDGACSSLSQDESGRRAREGEPYVVRFRSRREQIVFDDVIHGRIEFPHDHVDDFIIFRQDQTPAYNFAVVVDDMTMSITHVIRGADHLSNTPKQIMLFRSLGSEPPVYAHHSLLTGVDRQPLSKRHGATRVREFREMGILREALINYLGINGRKVEKELMGLDELAGTFTLQSFSSSDSLFDMEKLLWLNREYLVKMAPGDLCRELNLPQAEADKVAVLRENAKTLNELRDLLAIFEKSDASEEGVAHLEGVENLPTIMAEVEALMAGDGVPSFDEVYDVLFKSANLKKRELLMALRILFTGLKKGPPLSEVYPLLTKNRIMARMSWLKDRLSLQ